MNADEAVRELKHILHEVGREYYNKGYRQALDAVEAVANHEGEHILVHTEDLEALREMHSATPHTSSSKGIMRAPTREVDE